ncbi:VOC family protein [Streptomyces xanthii]|uniref:Glyoxalase n=1 Tax=Streptomyces xanthii TaxID=2768069 RepID=A0A7H1BB80_9ACTN|nr:VOC family protein [Streptomyces xanthii]QNS05985.1 glyoxalase [Streptomyces xanthii]
MTVRRIVPNHPVTPAGPEALDAARAFYERIGLEQVMDLGWVRTLASPTHPTAQISLFTHDATAPVVPDLSIEGDSVGELESVYAALCASGAEIVHGIRDEEWGVRRFFARDPQGRVVNVLAHL